MEKIKKIRYIAYLFFTIIFVLGLSISIQSLLADWNEPTLIQSPPNNSNYFPMVDASTSTQEKQSTLIINDTVDYNTLLVVNGDVGMGANLPAAKMEVVGGVKVGSDTICNTSKAGTLRFVTPMMEACDGTNWRQMLNNNCTPETDAAFCARLGKNCGSVTANDICGTPRTVPSCGTCPANSAGANYCHATGNVYHDVTSYSCNSSHTCVAVVTPTLVTSCTVGCSGGACNVPASCTLPWGGTIADGSSITAYSRSSVPCGSTCDIGAGSTICDSPLTWDVCPSPKQERLCTNGVLSGSDTYNKQSCTVASCIWLSGPCPGINVLSADLGPSYYWGLNTTASYCDSIWSANIKCFKGIDPNYPTSYALSNSNTVDFVNPTPFDPLLYPLFGARNACKSIGGRLPTVTELSCIYNNRTSYGNNFEPMYYWSSVYMDYEPGWFAWAVNFWDSYPGMVSNYGLGVQRFVRCVR